MYSYEWFLIESPYRAMVLSTLNCKTERFIMKTFNKLENNILKDNKQFTNPSVTGATWKVVLHVMAPIRKTVKWFNAEALKFDANTAVPEAGKISDLAQLKSDIADVEESIVEHSNALSKQEKLLTKAEAKVSTKKGKKRTKAARAVLDIKSEIHALKSKIGSNQVLHAKWAKKVQKAGDSL